MKTFEEIKDTIVNKLGVKDMDSYNAWIAPFHDKDPSKRRIITQEDIDLLSPDNVDNNAFWRVAEELFGADAVSSCGFGKLTNTITAGNSRNISLARFTGMLNFVDAWKHHELTLFEIGAGYGCLRDYCVHNTNFRYIGFDVYPKTYEINRTELDGTLPRKCIEDFRGKVGIVYSSNVFQHLSNKQRTQYFQDAEALMMQSGIFVFNVLTHNFNPDNVIPENKYAWDNRKYLKHYGQFTEIPYYPELAVELKKRFNILYETFRYMDGFATFVCAKKPVVVMQPTPTEETEKKVDNTPNS